MLFKPPPIGKPRKPPFNFPSVEDRASIVGTTGSGKTQFGGFLLSEAPFHQQPYVIIDFKREKLFRAIHNLPLIGYHETPRQPGLYRLEALPHEQDELEGFLWRVWRKAQAGAGGTGLFFDEGYLVDKYSKAWRTILVTGRSLHIPVYTLTQRPVDVPIWTISEADFHAIFELARQDDRERVLSYVPEHPEWPEDRVLPEYNSHWYDRQRKLHLHLGPAPEADVILSRFEDRLKPKVKTI